MSRPFRAEGFSFCAPGLRPVGLSLGWYVKPLQGTLREWLYRLTDRGYALAEPGALVVPHPKRWVRDSHNHFSRLATKAGEKCGLSMRCDTTATKEPGRMLPGAQWTRGPHMDIFPRDSSPAIVISVLHEYRPAPCPGNP